MELNFRLAQEADLQRVFEIYANARRFMAENGNPDQWGEVYPDESIVRADMEAHRLYLCTDGNAILGVFCYFFGTEPDYMEIFDGSWPNSHAYGVVHRLAVDNKGKGIASACLNYAYSKCGSLRIDTHRDNLPMQRTLSKNGFLRCGIIHCSHGGVRIAYQKI